MNINNFDFEFNISKNANSVNSYLNEWTKLIEKNKIEEKRKLREKKIKRILYEQ